MDIDWILANFRSPDGSKYPELDGIPREKIYEGKMGPGGLYLAALMARRLEPRPGSRILDLGCGRAASSKFLASRYGAVVYAVDLWIKAEENFLAAAAAGLEDEVIPLRLDVTKDLPFARGYFDAVFCMDSIHYYGGEGTFWERIAPCLKPGGKFCIGSPCFSDEFSEEALGNLPREYDDGTDLWPREFSKYHSPRWWKELLEASGLFSGVESDEIEDGILLWEDDVRYNLAKGGNREKALVDARQYVFRSPGMPYLTHFILCARKAV